MAGDQAIDDPPRVELYVRSLAPTDIRDRQEQVLERLTHLDSDDTITDFEVVVCGETVCPSSITAETDIGQRLLARHRTAKQWAEDRDRTLIGFDHHETNTTIAGTTITGVSFPRMLLLVRCPIERRLRNDQCVGSARFIRRVTSDSGRYEFLSEDYTNGSETATRGCRLQPPNPNHSAAPLAPQFGPASEHRSSCLVHS